jgi:hypothetical protein
LTARRGPPKPGKRIEECFGWLKTIALLRKVRHRGLPKIDCVFTFACAAYGSPANLCRRNPGPQCVRWRENGVSSQQTYAKRTLSSHA